jgi:hypothetical protein
MVSAGQVMVWPLVGVAFARSVHVLVMGWAGHLF